MRHLIVSGSILGVGAGVLGLVSGGSLLAVAGEQTARAAGVAAMGADEN